MKNNYFKIIKAFFLVFFFTSIYSFGQKSKEEQQIDNQIAVAKNLYSTFKLKQLLITSKEIVLKSEKLQYERGLVYGNFYTACALNYVGKFQESIKYTTLSQTYTNYLETDPLQESKNYGMLGINYLGLDLFSLCQKNLRKAIEVVNTVKNNDKFLESNKSAYYGRLSILSERKGQQDSMYYYLNKEKKIQEKLVGKDFYVQAGSCYSRLGNYFFSSKRSDSAKYYYDRALSKFKNHPYQVDVLVGLGNLYKDEGNDEQAFQYYTKAIEASKKYKSQELNYAYRVMYELYEKTGNYQKANEYKKLFKIINDSIEIEKKIERDFIINEVIKFEKEEEAQKGTEKVIKIFTIAGVLLFLLSIGIFYFIKRKKRELILQKETIIQEKEEENQELKQKVNESFEEVVQLAKDNHPEFLTRFQEVYPYFDKKLLAINPNLVTSELRFCAMLFLNFSTKDIAEYTFISPKTVQNRKNSIRKRLDISSEEDLYVWFKNIF